MEVDLNAPSGRDSQGRPLASITELIKAVGKGDAATAIANLNAMACQYEDAAIIAQTQLQQVVEYARALEQEAVKMGNLLANPTQLAAYYSYLEFVAGEIPDAKEFRTAYPQLGFDAYKQYLAYKYSNRGKQAPQQSLGAIYQTNPNSAYVGQQAMANQINTNYPPLPTPGQWSAGPGGIDLIGAYDSNPQNAWRALDSMSLAQVFGS